VPRLAERFPRGPDAARARARLEELAAPGAGKSVIPARPEELFGGNEAYWTCVAAGLREAPRAFDRLLLRLNLRRGVPLDSAAREGVLRFLALGYRETGDVRYFNELLWFSGEMAGPYLDAGLLLFAERVGDAALHPFPLPVTGPEAERSLEALRPPSVATAGDGGKLAVALLGPPHAFTRLHPRLREAGFAPRAYDFPAGERGRLRRRLRSVRLLSRLYFRARGAGFAYRTVGTDPAGSEAAAAMATEELDVGVHQLPFIIRRGLIGAFRLGILNDHLGVLPYVRGRSSVEWSLLFGFPVAATLHWIDEGVDTGPLLWAERLEVDGRTLRSVAEVKACLAAGHADRIVRALRALAAGAVPTRPNPLAEGVQFFIMHPHLAEYVEDEVLPRRRPSGAAAVESER
jgi:hypothetical protein